MSHSFSFRTFFPVILLIVFVPVTLRAQESAAGVPSLTIRAHSRLVLVDVIVTDKDRRPITGLTAEDFILEENGKKQNITIFTAPNANQTRALPAPAGILTNRPEYLRPAGVPIVLVLDAANSHFLDQAYGRMQMLKYVLEQSKSGATMAVMTVTDRLQVLQNFTSDPRVLATAIRNLQPQQLPLQPNMAPAVGNTSENPLRSNAANAAPSSVTSTPDGPAADQVALSQAAIEGFQNQAAAFLLERRTQITIQALEDLARFLGGFPGRKNVVWLTADFPFGLIPEDTNMSDEELLANLPSKGNVRNNVITNGAGNMLQQQRGMYNRQIREAEAAVASAGIAIYPVDMRGLMAKGIDVNTTGSLEEVAEQTGGRAYTNQNEITNGIALAASDEQASYSLGYYPENKKWDGRFRSIKVKLDQGGRELRYRKGYFALDPSQIKNPHFEADVAEALNLNAPATQISFMAQAKTTNPGKVRVTFLVDAHTVSAEDEGANKKLSVALYAAMFDSKGKDVTTRSIKIDRAFDTATYQQILDKGMMVPIDLDVPAGAKELRLAVLDNQTGFIGTVSGPLGQ